MGRVYTRVHRLLRLINAIQSRPGLNAGDLARLCEIHERTVYRDIETLNASGVPCTFDDETNGYRIRPGFFMPPVELTFEEAMAITAILEQVGTDDQIPFMGTASRAAEKIRSQLPAQVLEAIEPLDDRVRIELARGMADTSCRDVYDDVREAIANRRLLICKYESQAATTIDDEVSFEFRPYVLWFCQRAWYAVGHHGGRNAVRRLKLNRFISVQATDRPYAIPDDFDVRKDLGLAWRMIRGDRQYAVAIRFAPGFAETASDTRWHPTQAEDWHEDESVTLSFTVEGLDEIVWWVLGYGPAAKVLQPPELIQRVRQLVQEMAAQYG